MIENVVYKASLYALGPRMLCLFPADWPQFPKAWNGATSCDCKDQRSHTAGSTYKDVGFMETHSSCLSF